ncbi:MAG: NUDIX domain-containing protein [Bacteroidales bacterium]|nr:NUDIX domain-containing protein [Bacteroidales bacterium]
MNNEFSPQNVMKFCPRCGRNHFEANGVKSCKCADCGFVFYFNAATAVAVILRDSENRVLLTRRAFDPGKGTFDLPGGFVDPLEKAEDAVDREIQEELHLQIVDKKYLGSFPNTYLYGGIIYYTCDLVYECRVATFDGICATDDVTSYEFLHITDEVIEQVGSTSIKNILREYCL